MSKWFKSIQAYPFIISHEGIVTGERNQSTPVISNIASWLARISLCVAIFFIPFRSRILIYEISYPSIYSDYTNGLIFIADIFLLLTLLFWIVDLFSSPRRINYGPPVISIPLLGLLLASLMSVIFSISPAISSYHFIRLVILSLFYLYLVNEFRDLKLILVPIAAGVAVQSIIAIVQVMMQASVGLQVFGEYLLDPAWKGISIVYAEGIRSLRAYGLSDHPNILGGSLAFSLILLITWQATRKSGNHPLRLAIIFIGLVGLLLTYSRSAWLGFFLGMMVVLYFLIANRRFGDIANLTKIGLAGLIVLSPFLLYAAPYLGVRLNRANSFQQVENETRAIEERAALNSAGNELFVGAALTGVGIGTSPVALMRHKPVFPYYYQPPHNTFLDAAVETGIFGALFYATLITFPWLVIILRRNRIAFSPAFIAVTGALMAITVVGFFDYYPWLLTPGRFWQFLIWGLWGSIYQSSLKPG